MSLTDKITTPIYQALSDLKEQYAFDELGLAVSGGSDSLAMLYICKDWAVENKIKLRFLFDLHFPPLKMRPLSGINLIFSA